jgi:two-component sensor histidine kinase
VARIASGQRRSYPLPLTGYTAVPPEAGGTPLEEVAYRLRQQRLMAEFGLFALRTREVSALLQEASDVCAQGMECEFCKVMEYLPAEGQFLVRAGVGWKPGVVGHARVGADCESPTGFAFASEAAVISNHLAGETRFRIPHLLAEHGATRAINVLIRGDGEKFGILEVDSANEGRFTEADLAFLQGFANLLGVAIERQSAEESLRKSESLLQAALDHQAVLTREMSHRVKNSLGIVAGLLHMQGRVSGDQSVTRALADAEARVHAVARVHDHLWRSNEVKSIDLSDFLAQLCEGYASAGAVAKLICSVPPVTLGSDKAISLGLLANELITNATKYAYGEGAGEIRLDVVQVGRDRLRFQVSDHGVGLPPADNQQSYNSLGMRLIANLCRVLGGQPQWEDNHPGTRFILEFTV